MTTAITANPYGSIRRQYRPLLALAGPILVGQLGSIATGFADNIMVGHYSTQSLAAASFCNNVFNVPILCCVGFTMGITPLVGAYFAQKRVADIGRLMRNAAVLNVLFCLAVTAIMGVLYLNLSHLGQPDELLPLIRPYFLLCMAGILPVMLFNVFEQWSFGINRSAVPMWIILGGNVMNVIGNYALIYGHWGMPEWGLTGAGVSTLVARIFTAVAMIAYYARSLAGRPYATYWRGTALSRRQIHLVWTTSLPVAMQLTFETAAFSGATVLCGWLGTIPLAAFQIFLTISTLGFCVYYSLGSAIAVRVANAGGAGTPADMRRVAWAGYHIMLVAMTLASLLFVFGGPTLMHAFTDDPAVLAAAVSVIVPLVLYQLGDATQITFANALRGTGHVQPVLWIALFSYIVLGLPTSWLLAFPAGLGIYGIVLSFSVSLFTAASLFLTYFLRATRR